MNKKFHILFCDSSTKNCPVSSFIESCREEHQIKLFRFIKLLEELWPNLTRPYSDILHDGIHELRIKLSGEQVRLLYFFCFEKFIVIFHVLHKHEDRVPEKFIAETLSYKKNLTDRINRAQFESSNANNPVLYIDNKMKNPQFFNQYHNCCNICGNTVNLINKIHNQKISIEKLSLKLGISPVDIQNLEDAEKCSIEIVDKLCRELEIDPPKNCIKRK